MPSPVKIFTLKWVPPGESGPRGYVRDLRLRWACEEAGIPYEVGTVPFSQSPAADHLTAQPYGQVPWLVDGEISLFESGACLLHLARKSEKLMPRDERGQAETIQWLISALNSIEMVTVPWWFIGLSQKENNPLEGWLLQRLKFIDAVFQKQEWLAAGRFTVADLLMADVLRLPTLRKAAEFSATQSYVDRVCSRPAFKKAQEDQLAHFAGADEERAQ